MMNISYFHVANDVPTDIELEVAVVIDVLRATTTIACALNNGAKSIQTFADIEELKTVTSRIPSSERVLLGERGGKCLEGFDLGNSPVSVSPEIVSGKNLFMSTTNGTRSLERLREAPSLYAMGLINRSAVGQKLLEERAKHLVVLGSGWEGSYSLEDSLAAGSLFAFLIQALTDSVNVVNDEAYAALALWKCWENDIEGCLRTATHGKRLARIGNHDDDFKCCADLDRLFVVPTQTEPGVIRSA